MNNNETVFELRHSQLYLAEAKVITIEEMIKDQPKAKHTLSRADIILIFTVYDSLDIFYAKYQTYITECYATNYKYCNTPHYWLKYQLG